MIGSPGCVAVQGVALPVSYITVLASFLGRLGSLSNDKQQDALSYLVKLYCSAPIDIFTAYSLYPTDATATKGFSLLFVSFIQQHQCHEHTCLCMLCHTMLLASQIVLSLHHT